MTNIILEHTYYIYDLNMKLIAYCSGLEILPFLDKDDFIISAGQIDDDVKLYG